MQQHLQQQDEALKSLTNQLSTMKTALQDISKRVVSDTH